MQHPRELDVVDVLRSAVQEGVVLDTGQATADEPGPRRLMRDAQGCPCVSGAAATAASGGFDGSGDV
jgi:hypothetical protein